MISRSMLKNAIVLGLFAVATTGMITVFHYFTSPHIQQSQQQQLAASLNTLIPDDRYDNDMLHDTVIINDQTLLHLDTPEVAYRARLGEKNIAVIFPVIAPEGYSGKIKLLVAVNDNGTLAGVHVLRHKETPGLGDAIEIEKSNWLYSFFGKSLTSPSESEWYVKKDNGVFDQFTGATITPRAVVKAIHNALLYYQQQQSPLFATPAKTIGEPKND